MKRLITVLLSLLLTHSAFAKSNSCEETLIEVQALAGKALDGLRDRGISQARRALNNIHEITYQEYSTVEPEQLNNRGLIKMSHFLKGSQNCPGVDGLGSIIESGTIVEIIIDSPTYVDAYKEAIKVRVVEGIGSSLHSAGQGCEGWVMSKTVTRY